MASSSETCFFCGDDVENPQHGWSFKNSTNAQICRLCFLTLEQGTFCQLFHTHEDGWKNCDNCRKPIHYGCIMAFNTFEQNGTYAVTCKECIMKSGHVGDAASPMLNSKDCVQLGSSGSFTDMLLGEEFAEEAEGLYPLSDDIKNSHEMATEGSLKISESCNDVKNTHEVVIEEGLNISEPENSDLLFLFEKKLAPSDCDPKLGRLLVPKHLAEKYLPQVDGLQSMPLIVEDVGGRSWEFVLRWWLNKRSRKYVFYGTRKCVETMQWNAGDKIKFYRKPENGRLIIELERTHTIASESDASVPGDAANI